MALRKLLAGGALLAASGVGVVEARYRRHPGNDLRVDDEGWASSRVDATTLRATGRLIVNNEIPRREVMLCDVGPRPRLLGDAAVDDITTTVHVRSLRKDYPAREDGYWVAYVVKPARYHESSPSRARGRDPWSRRGPRRPLRRLWLEVRLDTYGFEGRRDHFHHVVLPLRFPDRGRDDGDPDGGPFAGQAPAWQEAAGGRALVRPVRTHLLGPYDDPVEVVRRYASAHSRPGDIVTIGETPLAVMQGRFRDPRDAAPHLGGHPPRPVHARRGRWARREACGR